MMSTTGKLYICATPIGNLEDITLRALRVLASVQLIAAEDTRRTRRLLAHYDIHTPLISCHEHNERTRTTELLARLKRGEEIALVSDAGTPGISDPGQTIVQSAVQAGITVIPVPGPSAVIAALTITGYATDVFSFYGFVPRRRRDRQRLWDEIEGQCHAVVLYEAPHRLLDTLTLMHEVMPRRELTIGRELTKLHEEVVRGLPLELLTHFRNQPPQGEFVLVLAPQNGTDASARRKKTEGAWEDIPLAAAVQQLMAAGIDKKAAIRQVAQERGLPRREVYREAIELRAQRRKDLDR